MENFMKFLKFRRHFLVLVLVKNVVADDHVVEQYPPVDPLAPVAPGN